MRNPSKKTIKWLNRAHRDIVTNLMCTLPCSDIEVYKIAIGEVHALNRREELLSKKDWKLIRIS
jgi:hypothetical protein